MNKNDRPLILFDPYPRSKELVFTKSLWQRLQKMGRIITSDESPMPAEQVEHYLPEVKAVIGQTSLDRERLDKAANLRAILNIEGNFLPNIDYETCFRNNIHVLAAAPAFAKPVAECALAFALDLARGVTEADRNFRCGTEQYGLLGNKDTFTLVGADIGLIGFGNLGQALLPFLSHFQATVRVYDPWLPDGFIREFGCTPCSLEVLLAESRIVFILAAVTEGNRGFLGRRELDLVKPGSIILLMSRAEVVDWQAFIEGAAKGKYKAATDVFPVEPVPKDDAIR
ncbi:MAG: NAD(P)-dependent oxidoreductase, partial [Desulfocapsaceae bacterium]|nr:NAD(P)-dependent oxidoreductase [Desulfocapsaceae bacterium]